MTFEHMASNKYTFHWTYVGLEQSVWRVRCHLQSNWVEDSWTFAGGSNLGHFEFRSVWQWLTGCHTHWPPSRPGAHEPLTSTSVTLERKNSIVKNKSTTWSSQFKDKVCNGNAQWWHLLAKSWYSIFKKEIQNVNDQEKKTTNNSQGLIAVFMNTCKWLFSLLKFAV